MILFILLIILESQVEKRPKPLAFYYYQQTQKQYNNNYLNFVNLPAFNSAT